MTADATTDGLWKQKDGTFIKIVEMETSQIADMIQMLERKAEAGEPCHCWSAEEFSCGRLSSETLHERPCYQELKAELDRRNKLM